MSQAKKSATKRAVKKTQEKVAEQVVEEKVEEVEEVKEAKPKAKRKAPVRLDENMLVPIASGCRGGLTYISTKSGQAWKFTDYGDEHVMELHEIRNMAASGRKFLQKGWIRILDEEVIEYLNLQRFQIESISPQELADLLKESPEYIEDYIKMSSANAKRLIFGYAKDKFEDGTLVNAHVINAIERALGHSLSPNN